MKNSISKSSLERLLKTDDQERNRLERKGIEMGKVNSPSVSSKSMSKFEIDEKNKLIKAYSRFASEASKIISKLEQEKNDVLRKLDFQIPKSADETDQMHQNELDQIQKLIGDSSSKFEEVSKRAIDSYKTLQTIKIQVNQRPLSTQFVTFYIPFMILLAFAEVFVNSMAFELFFESSKLISLIVATGIGAMLVFFAHITGLSFKKTQSSEVSVPKGNIYLSMGALNSLVAVLIYYLSKMREAFITITNQTEQGLSLDPENLLNSGNNPGIEEALGTPNILDTLMQINLGQEGMFLLLINVAVYVCGFVASFVRHDSHPDYEKAEKIYEKDRKELFKVKKLFDDKIAGIDKKRSDLHLKIKQNREMIEENLYELDKELSDINFLVSDFKNKVNNIFNEKISIFRNANTDIRKKPAPEYFKDEDYKIV